MAELEAENQVFSLEQISEEQDIRDVVMSLMVNPNLAPINYFNDFSEEEVQPESLGNGDTDETGIFTNEQGQMMAMTTHALHHHLENDP